MTDHTKGPWAVSKRWPTLIVAAGHEKRSQGMADDPIADLDTYAIAIARVVAFDAVYHDRYPHKVSMADAVKIARMMAAAPEMHEKLAALVRAHAIDRGFDMQHFIGGVRGLLAKIDGAP